MPNKYHVRPLPDGVAQRSNWQVQQSGERVSTHTSKRAAENAARRTAAQGDRIVLHRVDGTRQEDYRFQGSSDGGDGAMAEGRDAGGMFGPTPFDTWIGEDSPDSMFFGDDDKDDDEDALTF